MRCYFVDLLPNASRRSHWAALVREKLVPLRLLHPISYGIYEWSPAFRDFLIDLAVFQPDGDSADPLAQAQRYRRERRQDLLQHFSDEDLAILLLKTRDFGLTTPD